MHEDCIALSKKIVSKFVIIELPLEKNSESSECDQMYNYATDLLTVSLVWHGFHDAIKEGDGNRIIRYWKILLPMFQQEGHYNYAKEGFLLLSQMNLLSQRKVMELKWNRTINTHGRVGCNIPCDLHMEHLNRRLKGMMGNLGSNAKPAAIERLGKSLGVVNQVCSRFQLETNTPINKGYYSYPKFTEDLDKICKLLQTEKIYSRQNNRTLSSYNGHPLLSSLKWNNIHKWVEKKILEFQI